MCLKITRGYFFKSFIASITEKRINYFIRMENFCNIQYAHLYNLIKRKKKFEETPLHFQNIVDSDKILRQCN